MQGKTIKKYPGSLAGQAASLFLLGLLVALPAQALEIRVGKWQDAWNEAKEEFREETDDKKPSKTFLKVRVTSGLEKAAEAVDQAYADIVKTPWMTLEMSDKAFEKKVKALEKKIGKFESKAGNYLRTLKKADKDDEDDDYRTEIKVLSKHLEAVLGSMESQPTAFRNGRIHNLTKLKARKEGKTDEELREEQTRAKSVESFYRPALGMIKKARGTMAEVEKFLKKKYADLEQEQREEATKAMIGTLNTRARDASQQVNNILKTAEAREYQFEQAPGDLKDEWAKWGDRFEFTRLKKDSTPVEITDKMEEFEQLLERTENWIKAQG